MSETDRLLKDIAEEEVVESEQDSFLPPVDGGKDAWLFLAGCFTIEMLLWGFPFSYGILQEYYTAHEPFSASPSAIPIIGTSATGIMYLGSPFTFIVLMMQPQWSRPCTILGFMILILALLLSSFAQAVWHLILLQGVLYGVGGAMSYCPCILFMDEWFVKKKGLAFGIMWAGLGGLLIPFLMDWGLERLGFRIVLRVWVVILGSFLGPLMYYLKPRLPISSHDTSRNISFEFLRRREFWVYQIPNIIEGLGYFIPPLYLPSYASAIGLPQIAGPLTVSLFNGTLVLGTIVLGAQTDRLHVTTVILISAIGAACSVFILWGISISLPALCAFSIVYGFFAGAFSTSWSAIIQEIRDRHPDADAGMVFALLAAGRGVGNLASGPQTALKPVAIGPLPKTLEIDVNQLPDLPAYKPSLELRFERSKPLLEGLSELDTFQKLLTPAIIDRIIKSTNSYAKNACELNLDKDDPESFSRP
ncbi:hypothetical protein EPUS_07950 [Endocarpon pusillum Z07020]|uniref:Major facilitator superfamily (MFS) profile domain-containing protein n=1 Tax=Endocarpon pusillum (strain Z07020 / HMAS-L-300199) TaxID=1263415 RepID=U1I4J9_ENDPU|nr:uncharacterized protein EPUS_07950 [Endocarpon pusillum Z07020]ERF77044.1 hypothetical protein EPUS_07950 [Endocarpon pusillum Z07020]